MAAPRKRSNGGWAPLRGLSLDVRLALRLLVKHIGLTVVGTVAMAFAIWSGIVAFEFYTQIMHPRLPLDGGARIVGIVMVDTASPGERAPTLHDFVAWRDALTSVQDLAAYRDRNWNVIVGDAAPEPVAVAEISAATFRVVRERPVLGRPLVEADEKPGAPWVVVIGHDVWQSRFASDPQRHRKGAASRQRAPHHRRRDAGGLSFSSGAWLLGSSQVGSR